MSPDAFNGLVEFYKSIYKFNEDFFKVLKGFHDEKLKDQGSKKNSQFPTAKQFLLLIEKLIHSNNKCGLFFGEFCVNEIYFMKFKNLQENKIEIGNNNKNQNNIQTFENMQNSVIIFGNNNRIGNLKHIIKHHDTNE